MKHEQATDYSETINLNDPITELLPRYYEVHGTNPTYEIEESMLLDGHEVAWMRYTGEITYDIMQQGREGNAYEGHSLHCACHFMEGVGWEENERGPIGLSGGDGCEKKAAVVALQQLRLHDEYKASGILDDLDTEGVKHVLLDLIEKHKAGVFFEAHNGAEFWGGHYYLQTAATIMGIPFREVWPGLRQLCAEKRVDLEGMVVQEYRQPAQPQNYETDDLPQPAIHHEKPDKVWALVPQPGQTLDLETTEIEAKNRWSVIGRCVSGLAHEPALAQRRLEEALLHPRVSNDRLYQMSFVEPDHHAGALAVVAYTARNSNQPEEWVVEGFVGDAVVPEVHTLEMHHPTIFGIDAEDHAMINQKIEEWWPQA